MAVDLVNGVRKLVDDALNHATDNMVSIAKGSAPVDTGQLRASITKTKLGIGRYVISTNAVGANGVAYPLKIEWGEEVSGYQRFVYRGTEIRTNHVAASKKSGYMKNAISKYGGTYISK